MANKRIILLSGGPTPDMKLGDKEAAVKLELTFDDGKKLTMMAGEAQPFSIAADLSLPR